MKKAVLILVLTVSLVGCSLFENKKIEITKEYIINENWVNDHNGITIERMKIKSDDNLNIFDSNFDLKEGNHWNIINKLELDSLFRYSYNVGSAYSPSLSLSKLSNKKLYFNKPNKSSWVKGRFSGNPIKTLGGLENNTWYKFSKLTPKSKYFVFIYVDNNGKTHRFNQNLSNF